MDVARNHHHVVGRLVEYHQGVVAVIYQTSRGIDRLSKKRVVVGVILVFRVGNLQPEQAYEVYDGYDDDETADDVFPFFESIVFAHMGEDAGGGGMSPGQRVLAVKEPNASRIMKVSNVEAAMRSSIRPQL